MKKMNIYFVLIALIVLSISVAGYALPSAENSITGMYSVPADQEAKTCAPGNIDNCPDDYNPDQKDSDNDGIGDVCDTEYNPPEEPIGCGPEITPLPENTMSVPIRQTNIPAQNINVPVQRMPPPLTGAVAKKTENSSILLAIVAVILWLVFIMGITSVFREKIKSAYHKTKAKLKFHLKK